MKSKPTCISFLLLACSSLISASHPQNKPQIRRAFPNNSPSLNETTFKIPAGVAPSLSSAVPITTSTPPYSFNGYQHSPINITSTISTSTHTHKASTQTRLTSTTGKPRFPSNSTLSHPLPTASSNLTSSSSSSITTSTSQTRFHSPANSTLTLPVNNNSPSPTSTPVGSLVSAGVMSTGSFEGVMWGCSAAVLLGFALLV